MQALQLLPKSTLFNMAKKKVSKEAKFDVLEMRLECSYEKDTCKMKCANKAQNISTTRLIKLSEASDFADTLISSVKKKIEAKKIDFFKLYVNFETRETDLDIYYINQKDEPEHQNIKDVY